MENNTLPISEPSDNVNSVLPDEAPRKINWKQVAAFVVMTFILTWSLDLVLYLKGGLTNPAAVLVLQSQMLIPAFSAMILGLFFFRDSKIFFKANRTTSRWFFYYFLLFTFFYLFVTFLGIYKPFFIPDINKIIYLPSIAGLILLVILRIVGGKESFSKSGIGFGKPIYWLIFGIAIIIYSGLHPLLNWLFKLGTPLDAALLSVQASQSGLSPTLIMALGVFNSLIIGPFLGLIVTFGEEYGWRGYLQNALSAKNRILGVILVGTIWGIWHWPVILMGYNYPGHPFLGCALFVVYCIGLAIFLGYAVYKSGGVWIAAFLHALFNQAFSFFMMIYTPRDFAFSFGIGVFGILLMIPLCLLILRDPVWQNQG